jgi:hypothetical protein
MRQPTYPGERTTVPTEQDAGSDDFGEKEKSFAPAGRDAELPEFQQQSDQYKLKGALKLKTLIISFFCVTLSVQ